MDRNYIDREHIVERYLAGDLTVREAREFEKYCLEHPEILNELPIPVRLKARLGRRPLDTSETGMFQAIPSSATRAALEAHENGDDDEEDEPGPVARRYGSSPPSRVLVYVLIAALIAAVAGVLVYAKRASDLRQQLADAQQQTRAAQMQPPRDVETIMVTPVPSKPNAPTASVGWLTPPHWLDLRINMSQGKINQFQITIDKADGTRVMQIRRINRDSNREVRLALNSSAFGPGDYLLRVDGYNWRGQTEEIGWIMLGLQ